jgi:hypothetical protein
MLGLKPPHDAGHEPPDERVGDADRRPSDRQATNGVDRGDCTMGCLERLPRRGQKRLAELREHNLMSSAIEQRYAELELQLSNLGTDVRLHDEQPLGGPRKAARICDGDDVTKLVQLHDLNSRAFVQPLSGAFWIAKPRRSFDSASRQHYEVLDSQHKGRDPSLA